MVGGCVVVGCVVVGCVVVGWVVVGSVVPCWVVVGCVSDVLVEARVEEVAGEVVAGCSLELVEGGFAGVVVA